MQHIWHKCNNECQVCEGGLAWCIVCDGFEGSLLTHCPGYRLSWETIQACYNGNVKDMVQYKARIVNGKLAWKRE